MKELSVKEKAKAYDEAIERAKSKIKNDKDHILYEDDVIEIFPELKESEDERIKKCISLCLEECMYKDIIRDYERDECLAWLEKQGEYDKIVEKAKLEKQRVLLTETNGNAGIDWDTRSLADTKMLLEYGLDFINKKLEKQGEKGTNGNEREIPNSEQKPTDKIYLGKKYKCIASPRYSTFMIGKIYKPEDKFLCSLMNFCSNCFEPIEGGEQKSVDKVEPKDYSSIDPHFFKTTDKNEPKFKVGDFLVNDFCMGKVIKLTNDAYLLDTGQGIPFSCEHNVHLWTLADAKEGDVLAFDNNTIVIFKDLYNKTTFHSYCHIEDDVFSVSPDELPDWWEGTGFVPATKEQYKILMKAITDNGYEWDAEKKELKKIEQNPTWSEEDEVKRTDAIKYLELFDAQGIHGNVVESCINWLKNLQGRVQLQPKQEWNKDDDKNFNEAISYIKDTALRNWLISFKDKAHPQQEWNEEDSKRLQRIIDFLWYNRKGDTDTIYQQEQDIEWLKSLRPQNNITDEELAQAKKEAYNNALDKIEYHSGEPTYDDGWHDAIDCIQKNVLRPQTTWKPSDEQMEALLYEVNVWDEDSANGQNLKSLYQDLKKLREE